MLSKMELYNRGQCFTRRDVTRVLFLLLACFPIVCSVAVPPNSLTDANDTITSITVEVSRRAEVRLSPLELLAIPNNNISQSENSIALQAKKADGDEETSAAKAPQSIGRNDGGEDKLCKGCSKQQLEEWIKKTKLREEEEKLLRIEIIKAQILDKLGLSEPPNVEFFYDLPEEFNEEDGYYDYDSYMSPSSSYRLKDDAADFDGSMQADAPAPKRHRHKSHRHEETSQEKDGENRVKQIVLYGKKVEPCLSSVPALCLTFTLSQRILNIGQVTAARLRFHRIVPRLHDDVATSISKHHRKDGSTTKDTIALFHSKAEVLRHTENGTVTQYRAANFIDSREVARSENVSVSFDVSHTFRGWLRHTQAHSLQPGRHHKQNHENTVGLQLQCKTCQHTSFDVATNERQMPYIVLSVGAPLKRQRRHIVECQPLTTTCCRESLYIDFRQIGWSNWILQPSGYYANFCRGECNNLLLPASRHHTMVSQQNSYTSVPKLKPCCAPTRYSPVKLLYYDKDGQLIDQTLNNLQVESCGCAS